MMKYWMKMMKTKNSAEYAAELRKESRIKLEEIARYSTTELNQTERELCDKLMLIATVLIAVTAAVIAGNAEEIVLNNLEKILLISSLASLVLSVISGVGYYLTMIKFHSKWRKKYYSSLSIFTTPKNDDLDILRDQRKTVSEALKSDQAESDHILLTAQILLITIGGIGYTVTSAFILLK
jgi:cation transporter-like permease